MRDVAGREEVYGLCNGFDLRIPFIWIILPGSLIKPLMKCSFPFELHNVYLWERGKEINIGQVDHNLFCATRSSEKEVIF